MKPYFETELGKLYNGDCLEVLKTYPDNHFDVLLTDPPYGLNIDGQKRSISKNPKHNRKEHKKKDWDKKIPSKEYFEEMLRVSKKQIIFGANYFNEYLPQGHKGWIIWDKGQRGLTMSDCEIIYSSYDVATRIITYNRVELLKDNTFHPTQKPEKLINEILIKYVDENEKVLDCFSGSGVTAYMCEQNDINWVAIEKEEDYCFKTVQRFKNGVQQTLL